MIQGWEMQDQIRRRAIIPAVILFLLGVLFYFTGRSHFYIPWIFCAWFVAGILINPVIIKPIDAVVSYLTIGILWLTTRIMLTLVYFLIITPIGLWFRITGRDRLHREIRPEEESYWHKRPPENQVPSCEKQY